MLNKENITQQVIDIAQKAGAFIKGEQEGFSSEQVEKKGFHDYVTYVDKKAENLIVEGLKNILPEAGYIAEEGTQDHTHDTYNWIIDPLDGTTNFIHGLSPYAVSIALMENQEIIVGVVYEIGLDECFYAYKGGGAFLNGKQIHVTQAGTMQEALIATGFPYTNFERLENYMEALKHLMQESRGVRRLGSAATDLAYVACGRFEAFFEYNLHAWDVAAGAFIVQEAGGKVSDFKGGGDYIFGGELVATNQHFYQEFFDFMNRSFVSK